MTSQSLYIRLVRPFSRSSEEESSIGSSAPDLVRDFRPPNQGTKSRLHIRGIAELLRLRNRFLHDPSFLITGTLVIACVVLYSISSDQWADTLSLDVRVWLYA